jgi:hypothetical protein
MLHDTNSDDTNLPNDGFLPTKTFADRLEEVVPLAIETLERLSASEDPIIARRALKILSQSRL